MSSNHALTRLSALLSFVLLCAVPSASALTVRGAICLREHTSNPAITALSAVVI